MSAVNQVNSGTVSNSSRTPDTQDPLSTIARQALQNNEEIFGVVLRKNSSTEVLDSQPTDGFSADDPAISERHGVCWKCVGSRIDKGGKIYLYRLRDEYTSPEAVEKKNREIFPAVESDVTDFRENIKEYPWLKQLGYSFSEDETGIYLMLPDAKVLKARFDENLLPYYNGLQPLEIIECEGLVSNFQFIEAYLSGALALLSTREAIHDHTAHVFPNLRALFKQNGPQEYYRERQRLGTMVREAYDRIKLVEKKIKEGTKIMSEKQLTQITTFVGLFVDNMWADEFTLDYPSTLFKEYPYKFIRKLLKADKRYEEIIWPKRFPGSDRSSMIIFWHRIMTFDQSQ